MNPSICLAFIFLLLFVVTTRAMTETDRIEQYNARKYTWPIPKYVPDTQGWTKLMNERFAQVAEISGSNARYEGYMQTMASAILAQNFTELGFGLTRAPEALTQELRQAIFDGLETQNFRLEQPVDVIEGPQAVFIDRPDLMKKVLNELKPYVEAWSGVEVVPYRAYGFRLYRNQSALHMHADKPQTHVLSFIYHLASSEDSEPWPIFIEDFHGNTHEVILTPGDMLFYESSKCFHGRPRKFNGSWYNSIFVHYHPIGWDKVDHALETHYSIPPQWKQEPSMTNKQYEPIQMVGTSMKEPNCPDQWCRTQDTIQWSGPGEEGVWIAPNFEKHPLNVAKN